MNAQLTTAQIALQDSDAIGEICMLYAEMNAVVKCLDETFDASGDARKRTIRAKALTMALDRLIQEVGKQSGAC